MAEIYTLLQEIFSYSIMVVVLIFFWNDYQKESKQNRDASVRGMLIGAATGFAVGFFAPIPHGTMTAVGLLVGLVIGARIVPKKVAEDEKWKEEFKEYLEPTQYIDWRNPKILEKAEELWKQSRTEEEYLKNAYYFVRDEISHSWDVNSPKVSITASDVLKNATGICWTKSCLFAALLRAKGIPSGISYQYLTWGDTPDTGYRRHALNTIYLRDEKRWTRLDARGNRESVHAQFDLKKERLGYTIREEVGEMDYRDNHPDIDEELIQQLIAGKRKSPY